MEDKNLNRSSYEFAKKHAGYIVTIVIFSLAIIAFVIWFAIEYIGYENCRTTESFYCPRIFCNDLPDGSSATKCYNSSTQEGDRVAWRDLPDGSFECQGITIRRNITTDFDYSSYSR